MGMLNTRMRTCLGNVPRYGAEKIVNGDFSSALGAEWNLFLAGGANSIAIVGGELVFTHDGNDDTMYVSQDFVTIAGEIYAVSINLVSQSGLINDINILVGTTLAGTQILNYIITYGVLPGVGVIEFDFVPTGTTTWLTLVDTQADTNTSNWDDVSVKQKFLF